MCKNAGKRLGLDHAKRVHDPGKRDPRVRGGLPRINQSTFVLKR